MKTAIEVYRNLNRDAETYSLRKPHDKVFGYVSEDLRPHRGLEVEPAIAVYGVQPWVSEKGRKRVLDSGVKGVHATLRGLGWHPWAPDHMREYVWDTKHPGDYPNADTTMLKITYNVQDGFFRLGGNPWPDGRLHTPMFVTEYGCYTPDVGCLTW